MAIVAEVRSCGSTAYNGGEDASASAEGRGDELSGIVTAAELPEKIDTAVTANMDKYQKLALFKCMLYPHYDVELRLVSLTCYDNITGEKSQDNF